MTAAEQIKQIYQSKKVLIVGLGLQGGGVGVARFFASIGAQVTVTDMKSADQLRSSLDELKEFDIKTTLGQHDINDFLNADFIIKGPSVRWDMPEIKAAQEKGIPVQMEAALFAKYCVAPIVGITGTRGKSTTTQMIYEAAQKLGRAIHLAGNIPQRSTLELINKVNKDDLVILELSSWQLSGFHQEKISPHIGVFTTFYPDHLNYYKTMDAYLYDKKAIYMYQGLEDIFVTSAQVEPFIERDETAGQKFVVTENDFPGELAYAKGKHNKLNAALAYQVALALGIDKSQAAETIAQFKGLEYRQQIIEDKDNIIVINDTTSTTPVATQTALSTFTDRPVVLIFGGTSKGLPTDEVVAALKKAEYIVLLDGTFTDEIMDELTAKYPEKLSLVYDDFKSAIREAIDHAKKLGKPAYVLFSPGATSFGMFNNEFDRGDRFNALIQELL
jgi:UDP-N-acetylmuramoylalanine--D-glutamate ligase